MQHAILNGKELVFVDSLTWAKWFGAANRTVAKTVLVPEKVEVSTVFLGLDHGFGGVPLWFETLVFGGDSDGHMDRYTTWDEAQAGHLAVVEDVKRRIEGSNVLDLPLRKNSR